MLRGSLSSEDIASLNAQLPDFDELLRRGSRNHAAWDGQLLPGEPDFPIAGTCLSDAIHLLGESRFAVYEALAHRLWHQRNPKPDDSAFLSAAAWTAKFYADDCALRLYAVGEHLAHAIVFLCDVDRNELTHGGKGGFQVVVGKHFVKNYPQHRVTALIQPLISSTEWRKTMDYRNTWVHEQPPGIEGVGIRFKRKSPWKEFAGGKSLVIGVGADPPDLTVDELLQSTVGALQVAGSLASNLQDYYDEELVRRTNDVGSQ